MTDGLDAPAVLACCEAAGLRASYGQLTAAARRRVVCVARARAPFSTHRICLFRIGRPVLFLSTAERRSAAAAALITASWQVAVLGKADPSATVRGRRTTMLTDSDIHATRHARASVGDHHSTAHGNFTLRVDSSSVLGRANRWATLRDFWRLAAVRLGGCRAPGTGWGWARVHYL